MRTTLNLDDDVAARLAELSRRSGRSLSRVSNDVLRVGLRTDQQAVQPSRYEPPVFDSGAALIDVTNVGEALDVLDDS